MKIKRRTRAIGFGLTWGAIMVRLRHKGIYKLPNNQRDVIAFEIGDGKYALYDREYGVRLSPRYTVQSDGKLINWFADFPFWTVDELVDTGETDEL